MHAALFASKTGLTAQDKQLTTISNNLANASTAGYKRDRVIFEDLLYQIQRQPGAQSAQNNQLPSGLQLGTGVRVVGTQKQFSTGNLQVTDQPLDMAIDGRGFFEILQPNGTTAYTRNGEFHLSVDGEIVTAGGLVLEPSITIPEGAQTVTIGQDGTVSVLIAGETSPTQVGNVQLADFINPAGLQAMGSNLFLETASSGAAQQGTPGLNGFGAIRQGSIENSNVNIVEELVNMITTQRTYEVNSKVLQTTDQMLQFITQNI
ncbi:flagellar basal-body rod protein FlgG [Pseudomonadales bacterium]|nr:flagellar basal-body rod protein FlgG [Pseudomonadales bacterium]MDG1937684.1 flagellar basal-body rod protein FlgG [Pseudomonadales bacterium]